MMGVGIFSYGSTFDVAKDMQLSQTATVDSDGNLIALYANPEGSAASGANATVDWAAVDRATGADPQTVVAATPDFTPPFAFDERHAWTGSYPGHPEIKLTFEAASWRGRLNYARVLGPWDRQASLLTPRITAAALQWFYALGLLAGFVLALYNLRRKRGDVRSATRLASLCLALVVVAFLFAAQHQSHEFGDYVNAFMVWLGTGLVYATFIWLAYIAIEPLTRRRVPQLLVASSLILQGRWRSPRVGKEILVGAAFGVLCAIWWQTSHALEWGRMPGATLDVFPGQVLAGFRDFVAFTLIHATDALSAAALMTVLFTLFLVIFRKKWVGFVLLVVADLLQEDARGALLPAVLVTIGYGLTQAYLFVRVGLVAVLTVALVANLADCSAWARDWSSWLLPETLWSVGAILAITALGFWLAIGGQKPFGELKLEE
jgi:serine/threonine-protein kinase